MESVWEASGRIAARTEEDIESSMAATAQGDEVDHAGRLKRGLPRDLGGVALGDFDALGGFDERCDFDSRCDFVRNRFGHGLCVMRNRDRSRVLDDSLRADPIPPLAFGTLHLLLGGQLDLNTARDRLCIPLHHAN